MKYSVNSEAEAAPLLFTNPQPHGTFLGTLLNISKNAVGGGILALPFMLHCAGVTGGLILIALFGLLGLGGIMCVSRACESLEFREYIKSDDASAFSYRKLMFTCYGEKAALLMDALLVLYTCGTQISYSIFLADFMGGVLTYFYPDTYWSYRVTALAIAYFILSLLVILNNLELLKYTSAAGLSFLFYSVIVIVYEFFAVHGGVPDPTVKWGVNVDGKLLEALPLICFAYGVHYNIPRFYGELRDRTASKLVRISTVSYGSCTLLYLFCALFGYFTFGESVESDIIKSYSYSDTKAIIARIGLSVEILATFPIVHSACRNIVASWIIKDKKVLNAKAYHISFQVWCISLLIMLACFAVGYYVTSVGTVIAYVSAILGSTIYFILPALFFYHLSRDHSSKHQYYISVCVFVGGVCNLILGTVGTALKQS